MAIPDIVLNVMIPTRQERTVLQQLFVVRVVPNFKALSI